MAIREVQIADYFDQALPLMRENWAETGFDFEFAPCKETYVRLQEAGLVFALAAFDGDDIVGYCSAAIVPHPFNPAIRYCATDTLFVRPSRRHGTLPGRLILKAEEIAKERGAHFIAWHTRAGTPLADAMSRHGYQPHDVTVVKEL